MDTLTLLQGRLALDTTMTKIKLSLDEIREKSSHRVDLISSMSETLTDLHLVVKCRFKLSFLENSLLQCSQI